MPEKAQTSAVTTPAGFMKGGRHAAGEQGLGQVGHNGRGGAGAAEIRGGPAVEITHPHGQGILRGVGHGPQVPEVGAGPGLDGHAVRRVHGRGAAEDAGPGHGVAQDVADDKGGLGRKDRRGVSFGGIQGEAQGSESAAVRQAGVSRGQLQEADLGVAHHHTQAVVLRGEFRMVDEVESGQGVIVGLRPHEVEEVDGGEVQGIAQGLPERNGAVGDAIEVGRDKLAPGGAVAPFHVFQHRGRA